MSFSQKWKEKIPKYWNLCNRRETQRTKLILRAKNDNGVFRLPEFKTGKNATVVKTVFYLQQNRQRHQWIIRRESWINSHMWGQMIFSRVLKWPNQEKMVSSTINRKATDGMRGSICKLCIWIRGQYPEYIATTTTQLQNNKRQITDF